MGWTLETYPADNQILALLSVAEMKENLRISYVKEDELIKRCILAAYDWLAGSNGWLNRSILGTTWKWTGPAFSNDLELPWAAPAISLTSFTYLLGGVATAVPVGTYQLIKSGANGFARIKKRAGETWPTDGDIDDEAIAITYVAGLADGTGAAVRTKHMALHKGMALLAGDYFRNREDTFTDIRMVEIDRKIVNGVNRVAGRYRFMNNHG